MSIFVVPAIEETPWPTLGGQVAAFIEAFLVYGPGDLKGQPARLDAEKLALLYRMYEVYPKGHELAGRRRFKRVAISLRKGSAKTEFAAWIAAAELHRDGPVRCGGWDAQGQPVGVAVADPYIPMVAYTEEQSEDLAYGALRVILENSQIADDFDIGLERIMRISRSGRGDGKAEALASAPDARDGARTTWQHFDETHRFVLPRLKKAHRAMLANIPKRKLADAWSLETTTAPAPGERSVAEETMEYAQAVAQGRAEDARLFFYHREASDEHDLDTPTGLRAAVLEASGPLAQWSDIDGIADQWKDPTADRAYLARVWLNRLVRATAKAFDSTRWKELARPNYQVAQGSMITLGFDGARYRDSTALVGCEISTGFEWILGLWEKPYAPPGQERPWEVPVLEVNAKVAWAFETFEVWRLYADPPYWETQVAEWARDHGDERVISWSTNKWQKIASAVRAFANAITGGELSHEESEAFARHIANAYRRLLTIRDDRGEQLFVIQKERPDSPLKIDAGMAGILAWEARRDAVTLGMGKEEPQDDMSVMVLG